LIVIWWIATPSVCGAFLSSSTCEPLATASTLERPDAEEMPCHGGRSLPESAPVENGNDEGCCGSVELAASAKSETGAQIGLPPVAFASAAVLGSPHESHPSSIHVVEEIHSPYRRTSPPLLN